MVQAKFLEKVVAMTNFDQEQAIMKFLRQLRSWGVDDTLREKGCKDGVTVDVMGYVFDFVD
jgi:GTP-binding protein